MGRLITAIVTPFAPETGAVDEEAFVDLLGHVCAHGSDGVVVCGSTGEAATLTDEEHLRVIELAVQSRPSGAAIIAATGTNDTRHTCELTAQACGLGADAILAVTPYYVRPNRRGVVRHYEEVARAAGDRPVLLYNIPSRSAIDLPNDLLAELAQIEGIEGVKQSNPDNLAPVDGLTVYAGNDDMLADTMDIGGAGLISVAAHVAGERIRAIADEADSARRHELEAELMGLYDALSVTTNPIPIKAALNLLGHRAGTLRLPLVDADEHERAVVAAALERYGLLPRDAAPPLSAR